MELTVAAVGKLSGLNAAQIQRLDASNRGLSDVADLSECGVLTRLDLSHNHLTRLGGAVRCSTLTWLDVSHNRLDSLGGLQRLLNLSVLRASHNNLSTCGDLSRLKNLKALILSHNQLSYVPGLPSLSRLNTLVLSHNQFEEVSVWELTHLSKLSLSHNQLKKVPNTQNNPELRELRLNDNKIRVLPESLVSNKKLKIVDLGKNKLKDISVLEPLECLGQLVNLNLMGNPLCDIPDYTQMVLGLRPSLRVLDSTKVDHLSLNKNDDSKVRKKVSAKKVHSEKAPRAERQEYKKNRTEELDDAELCDEAQPSKKRKRTHRLESKGLMTEKEDSSKEAKSEISESHTSVRSTREREEAAISTARSASECPRLVPDRGVRASLKRMSRGRSGVVAVKEVRTQKKRTIKKSHWTQFVDDHQIGTGQPSTWT